MVAGRATALFGTVQTGVFPGLVFNVPNDSTSWANDYTAERDQVLGVVANEVEGEP